MSTATHSTVRGVRRAMVLAVVVSLAVAAVVGIVALLGGDVDELQARVLLTTVTVAAFGTTALCHLAVVTRSVRALGFSGIAASLGAAACALVLVWGDPSGDAWWRAFGVLTVVAVGLAHANLLLPLARRRHPVLRASLAVTLVAIAVVVVMLAVPILTDGDVPGGETWWTWLGVVGILDALGTITLPVLVVVLRGDGDRSATVRLVLDVPPDVVERLDAGRDGRSREEAAVAALADCSARSLSRTEVRDEYA